MAPLQLPAPSILMFQTTGLLNLFCPESIRAAVGVGGLLRGTAMITRYLTGSPGGRAVAHHHDVDHKPEITDDIIIDEYNGLSVVEMSLEGIATKTIEILTDKEYTEQPRRNALTTVCSNCFWSSIAEEFSQIYSQFSGKDYESHV